MSAIHKARIPQDQQGDPTLLPAHSAARRALVPTTLVAGIGLVAHLCASFGLSALGHEWTTPLLVGGIASAASGASWKRAVAGTTAGLVLGVALVPLAVDRTLVALGMADGRPPAS